MPTPNLSALLLISNRRREEVEQLRGDLDRLSDHYQGLMRECDEKDAVIERLRVDFIESARLLGEKAEEVVQLRVELAGVRQANARMAAHVRAG